jgi:hypothetical protein
MYLTRLTAFGNAPAIVWYRVVHCFGGEFIVATEHIAWCKFLHVIVLHARGANGTIYFVPNLYAELRLDPRSETATADGAGVCAL